MTLWTAAHQAPLSIPNSQNLLKLMSTPGAQGEGGGRPPGKMKAEGGDASMINLSVQQVLSLWAHGRPPPHLCQWPPQTSFPL